MISEESFNVDDDGSSLFELDDLNNSSSTITSSSAATTDQSFDVPEGTPSPQRLSHPSVNAAPHSSSSRGGRGRKFGGVRGRGGPVAHTAASFTSSQATFSIADEDDAVAATALSPKKRKSSVRRPSDLLCSEEFDRLTAAPPVAAQPPASPYGRSRNGTGKRSLYDFVRHVLLMNRVLHRWLHVMHSPEDRADTVSILRYLLHRAVKGITATGAPDGDELCHRTTGIVLPSMWALNFVSQSTENALDFCSTTHLELLTQIIGALCFHLEGWADNLAKVPKRTRHSLLLLDSMGKTLENLLRTMQILSQLEKGRKSLLSIAGTFIPAFLSLACDAAKWTTNTIVVEMVEAGEAHGDAFPVLFDFTMNVLDSVAVDPNHTFAQLLHNLPSNPQLMDVIVHDVVETVSALVAPGATTATAIRLVKRVMSLFATSTESLRAEAIMMVSSSIGGLPLLDDDAAGSSSRRSPVSGTQSLVFTPRGLVLFKVAQSVVSRMEALPFDDITAVQLIQDCCVVMYSALIDDDETAAAAEKKDILTEDVLCTWLTILERVDDAEKISAAQTLLGVTFDDGVSFSDDTAKRLGSSSSATDVAIGALGTYFGDHIFPHLVGSTSLDTLVVLFERRQKLISALLSSSTVAVRLALVDAVQSCVAAAGSSAPGVALRSAVSALLKPKSFLRLGMVHSIECCVDLGKAGLPVVNSICKLLTRLLSNSSENGEDFRFSASPPEIAACLRVLLQVSAMFSPSSRDAGASPSKVYLYSLNSCVVSLINLLRLSATRLQLPTENGVASVLVRVAEEYGQPIVHTLVSCLSLMAPHHTSTEAVTSLLSDVIRPQESLLHDDDAADVFFRLAEIRSVTQLCLQASVSTKRCLLSLIQLWAARSVGDTGRVFAECPQSQDDLVVLLGVGTPDIGSTGQSPIICQVIVIFRLLLVKGCITTHVAQRVATVAVALLTALQCSDAKLMLEAACFIMDLFARQESRNGNSAEPGLKEAAKDIAETIFPDLKALVAQLLLVPLVNHTVDVDVLQVVVYTISFLALRDVTVFDMIAADRVNAEKMFLAAIAASEQQSQSRVLSSQEERLVSEVWSLIIQKRNGNDQAREVVLQQRLDEVTMTMNVLQAKFSEEVASHELTKVSLDRSRRSSNTSPAPGCVTPPPGLTPIPETVKLEAERYLLVQARHLATDEADERIAIMMEAADVIVQRYAESHRSLDNYTKVQHLRDAIVSDEAVSRASIESHGLIESSFIADSERHDIVLHLHRLAEANRSLEVSLQNALLRKNSIEAVTDSPVDVRFSNPCEGPSAASVEVNALTKITAPDCITDVVVRPQSPEDRPLTGAVEVPAIEAEATAATVDCLELLFNHMTERLALAADEQTAYNSIVQLARKQEADQHQLIGFAHFTQRLHANESEMMKDEHSCFLSRAQEQLLEVRTLRSTVASQQTEVVALTKKLQQQQHEIDKATHDKVEGRHSLVQSYERIIKGTVELTSAVVDSQLTIALDESREWANLVRQESIEVRLIVQHGVHGTESPVQHGVDVAKPQAEIQGQCSLDAQQVTQFVSTLGNVLATAYESTLRTFADGCKVSLAVEDIASRDLQKAIAALSQTQRQFAVKEHRLTEEGKAKDQTVRSTQQQLTEATKAAELLKQEVAQLKEEMCRMRTDAEKAIEEASRGAGIQQLHQKNVELLKQMHHARLMDAQKETERVQYSLSVAQERLKDIDQNRQGELNALKSQIDSLTKELQLKSSELLLVTDTREAATAKWRADIEQAKAKLDEEQRRRKQVEQLNDAMLKASEKRHAEEETKWTKKVDQLKREHEEVLAHKVQEARRIVQETQERERNEIQKKAIESIRISASQQSTIEQLTAELTRLKDAQQAEARQHVHEQQQVANQVKQLQAKCAKHGEDIATLQSNLHQEREASAKALESLEVLTMEANIAKASLETQLQRAQAELDKVKLENSEHMSQLIAEEQKNHLLIKRLALIEAEDEITGRMRGLEVFQKKASPAAVGKNGLFKAAPKLEGGRRTGPSDDALSGTATQTISGEPSLLPDDCSGWDDKRASDEAFRREKKEAADMLCNYMEAQQQYSEAEKMIRNSRLEQLKKLGSRPSSVQGLKVMSKTAASATSLRTFGESHDAGGARKRHVAWGEARESHTTGNEALSDRADSPPVASSPSRSPMRNGLHANNTSANISSKEPFAVPVIGFRENVLRYDPETDKHLQTFYTRKSILGNR